MNKLTSIILSSIALLFTYTLSVQSKTYSNLKDYQVALEIYQDSLNQFKNDSIDYLRKEEEFSSKLKRYQGKLNFFNKKKELFDDANRILSESLDELINYDPKQVASNFNDKVKNLENLDLCGIIIPLHNSNGKYLRKEYFNKISSNPFIMKPKQGYSELSFDFIEQLSTEGFKMRGSMGHLIINIDEYLDQLKNDYNYNEITFTFDEMLDFGARYYVHFKEPSEFKEVLSKDLSQPPEKPVKPIYDPTIGLTYFPRPLAPTDYKENENKLMGAFALTRPNFWNNIYDRKNTIPLTTDMFMNDSLYQNKVPGAKAWKRIITRKEKQIQK